MSHDCSNMGISRFYHRPTFRSHTLLSSDRKTWKQVSLYADGEQAEIGLDN